MNKKYHPERKSPRLQGYDYAQNGAYFVTICTHNRLHLFGKIENQRMELNAWGHIAAACWNAIPEHFSGGTAAMVALDVSVIMPDHVHGIVVLQDGHVKLGTVIGTYKAAVTREIRRVATHHTDLLQITGLSMDKIWQGRYHDHIIRNDESLCHIQNYIVNNPLRWNRQIPQGAEP